MILPVLIPMALGQCPKPGVINSIKGQSIPTEVYGICTEGVVNSQRNHLAMEAKFKTMRALQQFARMLDGECIALNDSDIVHLMPDNLERCIDLLSSVPESGYVACWYDDPPVHPNHIRNASCVMRRADFIEMELPYQHGLCICAVMQSWFHLKGKTAVYVDCKKRIDESFDN